MKMRKELRKKNELRRRKSNVKKKNRKNRSRVC